MPRRMRIMALVAFALMVVALAAFIFIGARAPAEFPVNRAITIEEGLPASTIARELEDENVVKRSGFLYFAILLFHDPKEVKAGAYVFTEPQSVFAIARTVTSDNPRTEQIRLTLTEGSSVKDYAKAASQALTAFDAEYFLAAALPHEGFLFPETYHIPYAYSEDELIALLRETYAARVTPLIASSTTAMSEREIVTLASLIEREANSVQSMRMISGILQNRLAAGMPLQVDASMEYVIDRPLSMLTPEDLTIDSPYNTYLYTGLPPTPIGNPGLDSITAVLDPIPSEYFYYITGSDGEFYYATTYEQHLANIEAHLK